MLTCASVREKISHVADDKPARIVMITSKNIQVEEK